MFFTILFNFKYTYCHMSNVYNFVKQFHKYIQDISTKNLWVYIKIKFRTTTNLVLRINLLYPESSMPVLLTTKNGVTRRSRNQYFVLRKITRNNLIQQPQMH